MSAIKFLGASVSSINSSLGWGDTESKLEFNLVEDYRDGDAFIAPAVGTPVYFSVGSFVFNGLLQDITKTGGSSGSPLYSAVVVDPRSLLDGVQVILSGFSGKTNSVPNVINPYGYLESISFGSAQSNSSGISWLTAFNTISGLMSNATDYGGPIAYKGYTYGVRFNNLPALSPEFRVSGIKSLKQLVLEIAEVSGLDIFVELDSNQVIQIYTISKINVPDFGIIENFITQTSGAVSKNIGYNMVNEPCSKMILGGYRRDMYFQYYNGGADEDESTGIDNPVWWYWGSDLNGNPVIGDGLGDDHVFTLDSRRIKIPGVGNTYRTSIGELRAALASQQDWESYLSLHDNLQYICNPDGEQTATVAGTTIKYRTNKVDNPHRGKASAIGIYGTLTDNIFNVINNAPISEYNTIPFERTIELIPGVVERPIEKLYNYVKSFASEHYGKKFMVNIPTIKAFRNELGVLNYNIQPCEGGYLTDSQVENGVNQNVIPPEIDRILGGDSGTYSAYVRFDNAGSYDFSEVPEEAIIFSSNGRSIFVKASVNSTPFFIDKNNLLGPRVLVELAGPVKTRDASPDHQSFLSYVINSIGTPNGADAESIINKSVSSFIPLNISNAPMPKYILPALTVIPVQSNVDRYGPWYGTGAIGHTVVEEVPDLTPWNYFNESNMNQAALAMVASSISNIQTMESGSIEYPGLPNISLGRQLLSTGPYVTNIQVNVSSNGLTTVYRMETWKPRYGALGKMFIDRISKIAKSQQQDRQRLLETIRLRSITQ